LKGMRPSPFCASPAQLAISPYYLTAMHRAIPAPRDGVEYKAFHYFGC
jgi:hypothetical protein